jgi:hypothetical protein
VMSCFCHVLYHGISTVEVFDYIQVRQVNCGVLFRLLHVKSVSEQDYSVGVYGPTLSSFEKMGSCRQKAKQIISDKLSLLVDFRI